MSFAIRTTPKFCGRLSGFHSVPIRRSVSYSLPGEMYYDPKYYEVERKKLLGPSWQLLTHESNLLAPTEKVRGPATYVAETIAGYPIIVTRNSETGVINGHLNICRHRGGPLEWDGTSGTCKLKGFTCKYHGWTFSLDGKLRGLPHFGSQEGVEKKKLNLWPIRVARWRGLVFGQIIPPEESLNNPEDLHGEAVDAAFLRENEAFCSRLDHLPLEDYVLHSNETHKIKCNWKVYAENYLEGYHIPNMHPSLNEMVDMNEYHVLIKDGFMEHIVPPTPPGNTAISGLWLYMQPTLAVNCYGNGINFERMVPTGPLTTEIRYTFLFNKNTPWEEVTEATSTSFVVTQEDIEICEGVQHSFSSGAYASPGPLSPRHENGIKHFQNIIRSVHDMPEQP